MLHRSFRSLTLGALLALGIVATALPLSVSAQEASPAADCPPLSPEVIQARVQEFIDATDAEDIDRLGGSLHSSYVQHWGVGSDVLDREGYLTTMRNLFDAFDDFSLTIDKVIVADDTAVVRVTSSGTQVLEFGGFAPSGQPATWTGVFILKFDDCGRIVEAWAEFDHLGRLIQQGSIVSPEATPAP